jgi:hypothetical protein
MRVTVLRRLLCLTLVCALPGVALGVGQTPRAEDLIDSVLAVVEGQIIMRSDVRAFLDLRLIAAPDTADPTAAVLDALIERQLVLEEVARYLIEEPTAAEVDARLAAVVTALGGPQAFQGVLPTVGYTVDDLEQVVRDELRIERYLARRFLSARQPTEAEVAAYFREHATEFQIDGVTPPFDQARGEATRRLSEVLRRELIDGWVASLSTRADVFRVPR